MNSKNHKGFSLLEVVFAIMLLGILGTSIFTAQSSVLRSLFVSHNKVSTCLYMHNALVLFRMQSNYSKKDQPSLLQEALSGLQFKKEATPQEKFSGNKLGNLLITWQQKNSAYASEQQFSYVYYDQTPKDEKDGSA